MMAPGDIDLYIDPNNQYLSLDDSDTKFWVEKPDDQSCVTLWLRKMSPEGKK